MLLDKFSPIATLAFALCAIATAAQSASLPNPPSSVCADKNCVTTASPATGTIKWHPGHYMSLRSRHRDPATELPWIDAIAGEPTVRGVLVQWVWNDLETSKGVYDFSSIDTYLAKIKSLSTPKRLIIRIEERGFGAGNSVVPAYLKTDPIYNGGDAAMSNGVVARVWEAPVMDRLIALYKALADRYDSDPNVEGISGSETSIGFSDPPATFSNGAYLEQLKRHILAARANWKHSLVFIDSNYLGNDAQMEDLIKSAMASREAIGGPDTLSREWVLDGTRAIQSDEVMRGERGSGTDYRGMIAIKSEVQDSELGAVIATFTPTQMYDTAYNINHANYIFWDRNTYAGGPEQQWATGILPLIRSVNGKTYTACPTSFANSCDTR